MNAEAEHTSGSLSAEDRVKIAGLMVSYGSGIDQRDWSLFRTCFTDDIQAEYGPFGSWQGLNELAASMEQSHAQLGKTLHRMSNIDPRADAHGVAVRTYVDAILMPKEAGGVVSQAIGIYDDLLRKVGADWKICKRVFTLVHFEQRALQPS